MGVIIRKSVLFLLIVILSLSMSSLVLAFDSDPGDGSDGSLVVSAANTIVNDYTYLSVNHAAGSSSITVNDVSSFSVGDEILIHQTQASSNAGVYEINKISSISGSNSGDLTELLSNNAFTAYSTYSGSSPSMAFDEVYEWGGSQYQKWHSGDAGSHSSKWLQVDFGDGNQKQVERINIGQATSYFTSTFKIQGSNDDSTWTDLHTVTGASGGSMQSFEFTNSNSYRYYRFQGTTGSGWWLIVELEMFEDVYIGLEYPLVNSYTSGTFDAINSEATQVVRVPQFTNVVINNGASITPSPWDGYSGGIVVFRATGNVDIDGSIDVSGTGFRGGSYKTYPGGWVHGNRGEGYSGGRDSTSHIAVDSGGGAGDSGSANHGNGAGGGGGGHSIAGDTGHTGDTNSNNDPAGEPGNAAGQSDLTTIFFGGGGGTGGLHDTSGYTGPGGSGGGIIMISSSGIDNSGSILANGDDAGASSGTYKGGTGGGAGGSIYLSAADMELGTTNSIGGDSTDGTAGCCSVTPSSQRGGYGSDGRIRTDYAYTITGSTNPVSQINQFVLTPESNCADGVDNNGDEAIDCADISCDGQNGPGGVTCEFVETSCSDNEDNDGDGDEDCVDSDCDGVTTGVGTLCLNSVNSESFCSDGIDNDNDGDIDSLDADCQVGDDPLIPGLSCIDILVSRGGIAADGAYWIDPDGVGGNDVFQVYCDMTTDGGGWTLIGKGREDWSWSNAGQGDVSDLANNPESNTVSTLPSSVVDLILGDDVNQLSGAVRIFRHGPDQDWRVNFPSMTNWDWAMDSSKDMNVVERTPTCVGTLSGNTRDTFWCGGNNDLNRIFTWAWSGHNNIKGWGSGSSVSCSIYGDDGWCVGSEDHALLRTKVWVKGPLPPEYNCADGADNDLDGDIDCADSDCDGVSAGQGVICMNSEITETDCTDGLDNDDDQLVDCAEDYCRDNSLGSCEAYETICDDGVDNDGDGYLDSDDSGCLAPVAGKQVFQFTGADQIFTVPAGVNEIDIKMWGAGGSTNGGSGAYVEGTLDTSAYSELTVMVGEGGHLGTCSVLGICDGGGYTNYEDCTTASYNWNQYDTAECTTVGETWSIPTSYNYGGGGNYYSHGNRYYSGGGRSAIRVSGEDIVTAGAGGSGAGAAFGGYGGVSAGGDGILFDDGNWNYGSSAQSGKGGTSSAGGAAGVGGWSGHTGGQPGLQYLGGTWVSTAGNTHTGAGAGAGWYGGGSGGATAYHGGAGGGGSSNIINLVNVVALDGNSYSSLTNYPSCVGSGSTAHTCDTSGSLSPNQNDPDYVSNVGNGAAAGEDGGDGLVVISYSAARPNPRIHKFTGSRTTEFNTEADLTTISDAQFERGKGFIKFKGDHNFEGVNVDDILTIRDNRISLESHTPTVFKDASVDVEFEVDGCNNGGLWHSDSVSDSFEDLKSNGVQIATGVGGVWTCIDSLCEAVSCATQNGISILFAQLLHLDETGGSGNSTCGDGVVEGNETCDDGNVISGDGCSSTCQTEGGTGSGQGAVPEFSDYAIALLLLTVVGGFVAMRRRQ